MAEGIGIDKAYLSLLSSDKQNKVCFAGSADEATSQVFNDAKLRAEESVGGSLVTINSIENVNERNRLIEVYQDAHTSVLDKRDSSESATSLESGASYPGMTAAEKAVETDFKMKATTLNIKKLTNDEVNNSYQQINITQVNGSGIKDKSTIIGLSSTTYKNIVRTTNESAGDQERTITDLKTRYETEFKPSRMKWPNGPFTNEEVTNWNKKYKGGPSPALGDTYNCQNIGQVSTHVVKSDYEKLVELYNNSVALSNRDGIENAQTYKTERDYQSSTVESYVNLYGMNIADSKKGYILGEVPNV